ncbi:hypothetical protein Pcinc_038920, partial [Petrolisthes cinctipes]
VPPITSSLTDAFKKDKGRGSREPHQQNIPGCRHLKADT